MKQAYAEGAPTTQENLDMPAAGVVTGWGREVEARVHVDSVRDFTANPAPLGLLGFGMTTVLLNLHNAGLFALGSAVLAMGIFYGGMAQIIAGVQEWRKGNTFGATAFTSYGLFWLSLVALVLMPVWGWTAEPEVGAMSAYLFLWGLFTAVMFLGTLRANRALQFVFASLTVLFILLGLAEATGIEAIRIAAGYEGIICGLSAIYTGLAQVLNEVFRRPLLPLGAVSQA